MATFHWFFHQPASAGWLKRDLAARRPELRFAFSRPGLTTFKVEGDSGQGAPSWFARAWGTSLGRASTVEDVITQAATLGDAPLRLHVFERDPDRPAEERPPIAGSRASALEAALRAAAPGRFLSGNEARAGELVLDVITAAAELDDDGLFAGWHRHDDTRGPFPGGVSHVPIPAEAPSRAWAKIEEAIRWSGLAPRAGEYAVELGSAPGGASYALLQRGLHVHGVDPGAMAPVVLAYKGRQGNAYIHHTTSAGAVERTALPRTVHWLLSDMNLAPVVAMKYVERHVGLAKGPLAGAFLTLKMNDDGVFADLPRLMERIEKLGARHVRYVQLPSHRSELVAILRW